MEATSDGPLCPQISTSQHMSEDCLVLNIFTRSQKNENKPVIVYIHGGALVRSGGHDKFIGSEYLMDRDIVLVTINYRLGAFGFLSTGTADAPGNLGFKDQILALKWIQRHIESFGGDKNCITLFGQSAGGQSVAAHMVSPMATGLFHRAIIMSGTVTAQWKVPNDLFDLVRRQSKILGFSSHETPSNIVKFLKHVPMKDLVDSVKNLTEFGENPVNLYVPVIEWDFGQERFLIEDPKVSFENGNFNRVPVIVGFTKDEFATTAFNILSNKRLRRTFDKNFNDLAPICLFYERDTEKSRQASSELRRVFLNDTLTRNSLNNLADVSKDLNVKSLSNSKILTFLGIF